METYLNLNVKNETGTLKTVVMGYPYSNGPVPKLEDAFDAKSYDTLKKGIYPKNEDIEKEMEALKKVFEKYQIKVFQPEEIKNYNQVFARDIAFVIDDKLILSNLIEDRAPEQEAYRPIFDQIAPEKILIFPQRVHVEGGDVLLFNDTIFLGTYLGEDYPQMKCARTNIHAIHALQEWFPDKNIVPVELIKHNTDASRSVLHLDCAFQPIGNDKALIYREGFKTEEEYRKIADHFDPKNLFHITSQEQYDMGTNVFSIAPNIVISDERFTRINKHMREEWGITVEEVPYGEIAKMGGLLRCSTMPLIRE